MKDLAFYVFFYLGLNVGLFFSQSGVFQDKYGKHYALMDGLG